MARGVSLVFVSPAVTVLLIAVITSVELYFAIAGSSFCMDVDKNVITYIDHFDKTDEFDHIAKYYISGVGNNVLMDKLTSAKADMLKVETMIEDMKITVGSACPDWSSAQLDKDVAAADASLGEAISFLEPGVIYKYYQEPVHDGLCRTIPAGLGWLIVTQCAVCFIGLPVLAILVAFFFRRFQAWKKVSGAETLMHSSDSESSVCDSEEDEF